MDLKMQALLDPGFQPMALIMREYQRDVAKKPNTRLVLCVERTQGCVERFEMAVFRAGVDDARNLAVIDRVAKTLLWVFGGWKLYVAGYKPAYDYLKAAYAADGARDFDRGMMERAYERPFEVVYIENPNDAPAAKRAVSASGRHLDGCRIGFDAGGSDRKVSAVIDGEAVYSEEVVWNPKLSADVQYQYDGILDSMKTAASKMPRVDAIGVSSAGIYVDNRVMVASLFLKVSPEDFEKRVKNIYIDVAREIGPDIPIEVANDGDVTALAGAMDLNDGAVLGIAMGTSEAGGYVDGSGNITGWLNELAFAPVDFNKGAMVDEWSGDYGCGVKYFSQDAVIKLAPAAGIELDEKCTPAEKLKVVQGLMQSKDARASKIFDTIGVYFGYAIAYYALFYDIRHVLIMGRVTSGEGGEILLARAREVLQAEFPQLAKTIDLNIPDESSRRVGQSVAAASLPMIAKPAV